MSFIPFLISLVSIVRAESPTELAWRLHETCATRVVLPNNYVRVGHCENVWSDSDTRTWTCKAEMIGNTSMDDGYLSCVEDPRPVLPEAPKALDMPRVVVDKDWMSKIAIEYYGQEGLALTPYLCEYNRSRGRIKDCDRISPGEEVLLPPRVVLRCEVVKSFGQRCSISMSVETARMIDALPTEVKACVKTLQIKYPEVNSAQLALHAKHLQVILGDAGLSYTAPAYKQSCDDTTSDQVHKWDSASDYVTVDANGVMTIVDYWGPGE